MTIQAHDPNAFRGVWVWVEQDGGTAHSVSWELMGHGRRLADALSGIAEDGTAKELQRMRELRREIKAEARISKEIAGTDARVQEREFLEYARATSASDEFEQLVGLARAADASEKSAAPAPQAEKKTTLPE